eukprot:snap_masked-scaffold_86-processed-gene-0.1-mRNA-1 protein AED:0.08 eAED:0.09 QI:0/-1/0/1/-1/1/1/0/268
MTNRAGKTYVISGGASGLGEGTVRRFIEEGANVGILDRDTDRGPELAKELGPRALFVEYDAMEEESIVAAVKTVYEKFGSIHGCVASAGTGSVELTLRGKKKEDGSVKYKVHNSQIFDFVVKVNLYGVFNLNKHCAKYIAMNEPDENGLKGVLINVASVAAVDGQKGQVVYAATKGALCSMTLPMARDLGRIGIRVMTILPGTMDTPMMAAATDAVRKPLLEGIIAPKRFGKPAEFAALCATIVDNSFLNGECIRLDGGVRMPYSSKY